MKPSASSKSKWLAFLALGAFSAGLRLYRLDQSFWYDEIISTLMFFRAPWLDLLTRMPLANHHPLYSLLAKLCLLAGGEKEWVLRLPAFLFGSLTPPVLCRLGWKQFGPRVGVLAGLFLSVAMWPVWFSQDARGYSAMILFCLLATDLFLTLAEQFSRRHAVLYMLAAAAALYSHLYSGAVIASHLLLGLIVSLRADRRGTGRRLAALSGGGLVLALLLYAPLLPDFLRFTLEQGRLTTGREMRLNFVGQMFLAWAAGESHSGLAAVFLLLAATGLGIAAARRPWLAAVWVLSLLLGGFTPLILGLFVFQRFFSYALPLFYLFPALALDYLIERLPGRRKMIGWLAAALVMLILALGLRNYYRYGKQPLRPAAEWIRQNAPGYPTLAAGLVSEVYGYYDRAAERLPLGEVLQPAMLRHTAVVVSHRWSLKESDWKLLQQFCRPPQVFPSAGPPEYEVRVYLCDAPPSP